MGQMKCMHRSPREQQATPMAVDLEAAEQIRQDVIARLRLEAEEDNEQMAEFRSRARAYRNQGIPLRMQDLAIYLRRNLRSELASN